MLVAVWEELAACTKAPRSLPLDPGRCLAQGCQQRRDRVGGILGCCILPATFRWFFTTLWIETASRHFKPCFHGNYVPPHHLIVKKYSCSGFSRSMHGVVASGDSLVPSRFVWNGDSCCGVALAKERNLGYGEELLWGSVMFVKGDGKVWRLRTMWPVVKQIRTWSESREDFI